MDADAIKRMFERQTPDRLAEIERLKAAGDQAGIDALIQIVHCPQEVEPQSCGSDWTPLAYSGPFNWRQRAWMRDTLAGQFCLYYACSGDLDIEFRFERSEDAVAFKMRWM